MTTLQKEVPGITRTADICGGATCIAGTRIPVWSLVQFKKLGASNADLLQIYPTLRAEDLENAWTYHRLHTEEIEQQIIENETA